MNEDVKSTGVHIHSRADELIACLECEIAKRDETIARLEPQLNRAIQANYDLRAELAEINAHGVRFCNKCGYHGPMETHNRPGDGVVCDYMSRAYAAPVVNRKLTTECKRCSGTARVDIGTVCDNWVDCPECAAPVSEAKAQGVVIPEPLMAAITRADDVLHALSNWESSSVKLEQRHGPEWTKEVDAIRRELHTQLARLNAAPVQQVSVPDERIIPTSAELIQWAWEEEPEETRFQEGYNAAKRWVKMQIEAGIAAPAAPAADAGVTTHD